MFLKINFQENTKKVKFHEKYQQFDAFQKFVADLTKLPFESLTVSFIDSE